MAGPTPRPFVKALACSLVAFALATVALVMTLGPPGPNAPMAFGYLFGTLLVPGLITGFFAWRARKIWPLWRIVLTFVAVLIVTTMLQVAGRIGRENASAPRVTFATPLASMSG